MALPKTKSKLKKTGLKTKKWLIAVVIIIVASIGGYLVYSSFAAIPVKNGMLLVKQFDSNQYYLYDLDNHSYFPINDFVGGFTGISTSRGIKLSPTENKLAFVGEFKEIRVSEISNGNDDYQVIADSFPEGSNISNIEWSPDGETVYYNVCDIQNATNPGISACSVFMSTLSGETEQILTGTDTTDYWLNGFTGDREIFVTKQSLPFGPEFTKQIIYDISGDIKTEISFSEDLEFQYPAFLNAGNLHPYVGSNKVVFLNNELDSNEQCVHISSYTDAAFNEPEYNGSCLGVIDGRDRDTYASNIGWSPDGNYIFHANFVENIQTGEVTELADPDFRTVDWQPYIDDSQKTVVTINASEGIDSWETNATIETTSTFKGGIETVNVEKRTNFNPAKADAGQILATGYYEVCFQITKDNNRVRLKAIAANPTGGSFTQLLNEVVNISSDADRFTTICRNIKVPKKSSYILDNYSDVRFTFRPIDKNAALRNVTVKSILDSSLKQLTGYNVTADRFEEICNILEQTCDGKLVAGNRPFPVWRMKTGETLYNEPLRGGPHEYYMICLQAKNASDTSSRVSVSDTDGYGAISLDFFDDDFEIICTPPIDSSDSKNRFTIENGALEIRSIAWALFDSQEAADNFE